MTRPHGPYSDNVSSPHACDKTLLSQCRLIGARIRSRSESLFLHGPAFMQAEAEGPVSLDSPSGWCGARAPRSRAFEDLLAGWASFRFEQTNDHASQNAVSNGLPCNQYMQESGTAKGVTCLMTCPSRRPSRLKGPEDGSSSEKICQVMALEGVFLLRLFFVFLATMLR